MDWKQKAIDITDKIKQDRKTLVNRDIQKIEQQLKKENELSASDLLFLHRAVGLFYAEEKNYTLASHHFQQAIKHRYDDTESEDIWVQAHLRLSKLDEKQKQYSQARMPLVKLLQYMEKEKKATIDIARIYQKIGWLFYLEEELHQAHTQVETARKMLLETVEPNDPLLLKVNDQLADIYVALEQPELAIQLFEKTIDRNETELSNMEKATLQMKIGELFFHIDLRKARRTISKAIKLVDEEHPLYLRGHMLLSEIEENMGAFPRAIKYYERSLTLAKKESDKNPFLVVFLLSKLGTIHLEMRNKEKAKEYLEAGLPLSEKYQKIKMQFLYALGNVYSEEKEYNKAYDMYTSFLQGLEQDDKMRTLAYANTLQAIAYNYFAQDNVHDALVRYSEAYSIYVKLGSNCREEKGTAAMRLAHCYELVEDLKEAEKYYELGAAALEKIKKPELAQEAYMTLVEFYVKTDQPNKKFKYEDKLVKMQQNSI